MPSVSVNPPKTPVTKGSNGTAAATIPNVCKMPGPPAPFVPAPLPNIGKSGDSPKGYSQDVTIEGKAVAIKGATFNSMGDMASKATGGGLISANTHGITKFVGPGSMDVKIEGKNVQLLSDPMLNNCAGGGSPPNSATLVGLLQDPGLVAIVGDEPCAICNKEHGDQGKIEETTDSKDAADALHAAAVRAVKAAKDKRDAHLAKLKGELQTQADDAYEAARKKYTEAADKATSAQGKAFNQSKLATLTRPIVTDADAEKRMNLPKAGMATMLGAVICKTNEKYGAKSMLPVNEFSAEVKGIHVAPGADALFDAARAGTASATAGASLDTFLKHVKNQTNFKIGWADAHDKNQAYNSQPVNTALTPAQQTEAKGEPFYPPGQCGGQLAMLLALEHSARPIALTERWFQSNDPKAKVYVFARTDKADKKGSGGWYGGDKKDKTGRSETIPPCGTCQIILTMLMCPEERPSECQHAGKPGASVCQCP